jgi:hypothetical protein
MSDQELDRVFANYRAASPDPEPSPTFMPRLWEAIEARRTFNARFSRLSRVFVGAAGAIWLLMVTLLILHTATAVQAASDFDILADSHTAESINLDAAGLRTDRK